MHKFDCLRKVSDTEMEKYIRFIVLLLTHFCHRIGTKSQVSEAHEYNTNATPVILKTLTFRNHNAAPI